MKKLTLAMIVKNESKYLARCLESVKNVVDEIIIVDTGSLDDTKEIAQSFGAKVSDFKWNNSFSDARNHSLHQSSGDWILVLDADEYLEKESKSEVLEFVNSSDSIGRLIILNKYSQAGEIRYSRSYTSRLFPRGIFFKGKIHEQLDTSIPRVNTEITIYHDGYYLTDKSERNLKLLLNELDSKPDDTYLLYKIAKEFNILKKYSLADEYYDKCYSLVVGKDVILPVLIVDYLYNIISTENWQKGLDIISNTTGLNDYPDYYFVQGLFFMNLVLSDVNRFSEYIPLIKDSYLACLEIGETSKYDGVIGTGTFLASYNLAVFYETLGDIDSAIKFYKKSASYNHSLATERLEILSKK